jgi:catechol 2,3-dioxygenase-like lactoylglutathione lyase family enzyme
MDLVSIRTITDDLERMVEFYEQVTGVAAVRYTPVFAEVVFPSFTLAIGHTQTVQLFGENSARPADNHSVIIEFKVDYVDSEYERLKPIVHDWVQQPTTMPWGNRSLLFQDPDGNLVNFSTPVTEDAIKKFSRDSPSLSSQKIRNRMAAVTDVALPRVRVARALSREQFVQCHDPTPFVGRGPARPRGCVSHSQLTAWPISENIRATPSLAW